jgi:hypothetical protein
MMNIDINEMKDYTEPTIPPMSYLGKIEKVEEVPSKSNPARTLCNLTVRIYDSYPKGGAYVDTELFLDPYDSIVWPRLMDSVDGDKPSGVRFQKAKNSSFVQALDLTAWDPSTFVGRDLGLTASVDKRDGSIQFNKFFKAPVA